MWTLQLCSVIDSLIDIREFVVTISLFHTGTRSRIIQQCQRDDCVLQRSTTLSSSVTFVGQLCNVQFPGQRCCRLCSMCNNPSVGILAQTHLAHKTPHSTVTILCVPLLITRAAVRHFRAIKKKSLFKFWRPDPTAELSFLIVKACILHIHVDPSNMCMNIH